MSIYTFKTIDSKYTLSERSVYGSSRVGMENVGQEVQYNDVIALTGVSGKSGNHFTTRNPHLHFEVGNVGSAPGFEGKCNPSVYFHFKTEDELSASERAYQDKVNEKLWGEKK